MTADVAASSPVAPSRPRRMSAERIVFLVIALSMLAAVVIGFAPTYYLRGVAPPPTVRPMPQLGLLLHLHGALFSAWMLLFVVQTGLVSAGRRRLHMAFGAVGLPLVLGMIWLGVWAALKQGARGGLVGGFDPLMLMSLPLFSVLGFALLFPAALAFRRKPAAHKRLMVLGMVAMISAPFARMEFLPMLVSLLVMPNLYLLVLIVWDLASMRRLHPATVWGGLVALMATVTPVFVMQSFAWLTFARWAVSFTPA